MWPELILIQVCCEIKRGAEIGIERAEYTEGERRRLPLVERSGEYQSEHQKRECINTCFRSSKFEI